MDINTLRGLATLFAAIAFLSICFWAYSSKRKTDFDEAAGLPFADENIHTTPVQDEVQSIASTHAPDERTNAHSERKTFCATSTYENQESKRFFTVKKGANRQ